MDEETHADVKWFDATPSNSSVVNSISNGQGAEGLGRPQLPLNKLHMYYNMSGNKYLHIFNHFKYENNQYYGPNAKNLERRGTQEDVKRLEDTFQDLGFFTKVHNDLRHEDILKQMMAVYSTDHSGTSCIAVAVLTHGQNGGVLLAADRPYYFSELTDVLLNCHPSLAGQPKLFFVQACRSRHLDNGASNGRDNTALPNNPDTLVVFSSSPHYLSYRNCYGSWLMQSLCEVLKDHHQFLDLLQMLTLVNQDVAYKVTYNKNSPEKSNKKQMPETKHTLTKLLKF